MDNYSDEPTDALWEANHAVKNAYQVIAMHEEIQRLRADLAYYKPYEKKYMDLLHSSIDHSHALICNTLKAIMDPDSRFSRGERAMKQLAAQEGQQ